jgi:hypothetical protein
LDSPTAEAVNCISSLVVFQRSSGRLGFGENEANEVLDGLLASATLVERALNPEWQAAGSPTARLFIRRHAGRGVFGLVESATAIMVELAALDKSRNQRKANEVRVRLGRDALPVSPTLFDSWITPGGQVGAPAFEFFRTNTALVTLWKHGEWGLHCRVYASTEQETLNWLAEAADAVAPMIIVKAISELPAW